MLTIEEKSIKKILRRISEFSILASSFSISSTFVASIFFNSVYLFYAYIFCILIYAILLVSYYFTFEMNRLSFKHYTIIFMGIFFSAEIVLTYIAGGFSGAMFSIFILGLIVSSLLFGYRELKYVMIIVTIIYFFFFFGEILKIITPLIVNNLVIKYSKAIIDVLSLFIVFFLMGIISQTTKDSINFYKLRSVRLSSIKERLEILVKKRTNQLEESNKVIRKRTEQLEGSNRELKRAREELDKSYKSLQKLDVEKDNFISIAAHELKTPLTAIGGYSQILQNERIAKNVNKRKQFLVILDRESKRLAELVTEILNLSRIDMGVMRYETEDINVYELMKNIEDEFSSKIKERGLKYEFILEKNLPKISSDKNKLYEIVTNLLSNAIKYTPRGKITVSVVKKKDHVLFSIADTGIGIARKDYKKMFKRFSQIDSSLKREVEGTGLGLSICKEYVEGLGGDIWLKSKLGRGSTFYVSLPIRPSPKLNNRKKSG